MTVDRADDILDLEEAITYIQKRTGASRRRIRRLMADAIANGTLAATAINRKTGKRETIPPQAMKQGRVEGFEQ